MKRSARLIANDQNGRIEVLIKFISRNGLVRHEVNAVVTDAVRNVHRALQGIQFTDFGAENIRVRM